MKIISQFLRRCNGQKGDEHTDKFHILCERGPKGRPEILTIFSHKPRLDADD